MSWQPPASPAPAYGVPSGYPTPYAYPPPNAYPPPAYVLVPVAPGPAPGLVYAGFWRRVLGYLLDGLIVGLPYGVVADALILGPLITWLVNHANQIGTPGSLPLLTPSNLLNVVPLANLLIVGAVGVIVYALYFGLLVSLWGRTVGQLAVGARVVRKEDLTKKLPLGRALARAVVFWVTPIFSTCAWLSGFGLFSVSLIADAASLLVLFALLWVAWDPQKQGLHDKVGRALVVRSLVATPAAYAPPYPPPYPYGAPFPYASAAPPGYPPAAPPGFSYPSPPGYPYPAPPGYPYPAPPGNRYPVPPGNPYLTPSGAPDPAPPSTPQPNPPTTPT
ncbi:MAG: RDD family protein [Candidatus Dormibacteria bacterium]|jgi:uncharacterized RDD family membrane protein YckC|nr:hypothetical protein [Chloroflexota bacterium]